MPAPGDRQSPPAQTATFVSRAALNLRRSTSSSATACFRRCVADCAYRVMSVGPDGSGRRCRCFGPIVFCSNAFILSRAGTSAVVRMFETRADARFLFVGASESLVTVTDRFMLEDYDGHSVHKTMTGRSWWQFFGTLVLVVDIPLTPQVVTQLFREFRSSNRGTAAMDRSARAGLVRLKPDVVTCDLICPPDAWLRDRPDGRRRSHRHRQRRERSREMVLNALDAGGGLHSKLRGSHRTALDMTATSSRNEAAATAPSRHFGSTPSKPGPLAKWRRGHRVLFIRPADHGVEKPFPSCRQSCGPAGVVLHIRWVTRANAQSSTRCRR